ncbi:hypothetical protein DVU_1751 [Nitratidesulfovibrio vulgaris str. Hildenborough]|uniref:Uncharacterized protein n=1 Tax=Nitratidesulfovibrio vulgaris (strain ATCC 29579 / DSM 644 / CCUG 34227 / NCIMB 8303 / VKM B-1760 / Hildenborough) TaxID=882 RepID=Q72B85_NITV2|nr:hypothetical protein DVU_1751 [Nitratidesulfovibrio vulgaris str. Hildenborough]
MVSSSLNCHMEKRKKVYRFYLFQIISTNRCCIWVDISFRKLQRSACIF